MSRIGKLPINVDTSVQVDIEGNLLKVKGQHGELNRLFPVEVSLTIENGFLIVDPLDKKNPRSRAMWGLSRTLAYNMIYGVSHRWSRRLEMTGVGYKASVQGKNLILSLGYSHDIIYAFPDDIEIKVEKPTTILISGADKQLVGQIAAEIRLLREPEPYKGKGIRYIADDQGKGAEQIIRKENKKK